MCMKPIRSTVEIEPSAPAVEVPKVDSVAELGKRGYRVKARVNKAGTSVVCAIQDCGSRFATIDHTKRYLVMAPGYAPDDRWHGVWKQSKRAGRRSLNGGTQHFRRYPVNDGYINNDVMPLEVSELPIGVRCNGCGFGNMIIADMVGVELVRVVMSEL